MNGLESVVVAKVQGMRVTTIKEGRRLHANVFLAKG